MSSKSIFLLSITVIALCALTYIIADSDASDAGTEFSYGGLDYKTTSDDEVKVVGFTDESTSNLIIPATVTYDGTTYDVTEIGMSAFDLTIGLSSVNLGNVSKIDAEAFSGCVSLTTVAGTELTSVGIGAFAGCISLSDISLGKVKTIGATAFMGCIKLKSVSLDKVITIGNRAFFETGLVSVTLPITTTSIGNAAFNKCPNLLTINVNSISYVSKDGAVYSRLGNLIIVNQYYILAHPNYTVPSAVKSINEFAFDGCQSLVSIDIPETVTSIEGGAFINCPNLESVNILGGESYKTIDSCVYSYDGKTLVFVPETYSGTDGKFTVPEGVETIESYAFSDCASLTCIDASNVKEVKMYAFSDCSSITSMYLNSDADYGVMSMDLGSIGNEVTANVYADESDFLSILSLNEFTTIIYYLPVEFSLENEPEGAVAPSTIYQVDGSVVDVSKIRSTIPPGNMKTYLNGTHLEEDTFTLSDSKASVRFVYSLYEFQILFECDNDLGSFDHSSIIVAKGTTFTTEGSTISFSDGKTVIATAKSIEHYKVEFSKFSADSGTVDRNMTITAEFIQSPLTYNITVKSNDKDYGTVDGKETLSLTITYGTTWHVSNGALFFSDGKEVIATPTEADQQYRYYFKYWDPSSGTVEGDTVIDAVFMRASQTYMVKVVSSDDGIGSVNGQPICVKEYEYGTTITIDDNLLKVGTDVYTAEVISSKDPNIENKFIRFDGTTDIVRGNLEITAIFESIISDIPESEELTIETTGYSATMNDSIIDKLKSKVNRLTVKTAIASLTFDKAAISKMSAATLTINDVDVADIPAEAEKAMKVIEIDFGSNHDFTGGKITVCIPMHSDYDSVTVGYVHDGKLDLIDATYNSEKETVSFEVDHLSTFAVFDSSIFDNEDEKKSNILIAAIAGIPIAAVAIFTLLVFSGKTPLFRRD